MCYPTTVQLVKSRYDYKKCRLVNYVGGNKNPPRYNEIILVAARFAFFAMSSTGDLVIWPHDDSLRDFLVLYSHIP